MLEINHCSMTLLLGPFHFYSVNAEGTSEGFSFIFFGRHRFRLGSIVPGARRFARIDNVWDT